jgi:hypothetical protein
MARNADWGIDRGVEFSAIYATQMLRSAIDQVALLVVIIIILEYKYL